MKPRVLDLFSGAGGAGYGYHLAGFEVVGVDNRPMKNYPFEFYQGDALEFVRVYGHEFDVIHASPMCQFFSHITQLSVRDVARRYPNQIPAVRDSLIAAGKPYVIENVTEALPWMRSPLKLCGSSFGLDVRRHRLFESNLLLFGLPCDHSWQKPRFRSLNSQNKSLAGVVGVHGNLNYAGEMELRQKAMDIEWMTCAELSQAIPPTYTQFLGDQLMLHIS